MKVKIAAAQYPIDFLNSFEEWQQKILLWIKTASENGAEYLLFPEYGSLELSALLPPERRKHLNTQAFELKNYFEDFIQTFRSLALEFGLYIVAPSFPFFHNGKRTTNRTYVFSPLGKYDFQDKLHMTRFEDEEWKIQPASELELKVFKTEKMNFAISTCFDGEFAAPAVVAAHNEAHVLLIPSCTETLKGMHRVHIGARARALENQMYVVVSQLVGTAEWSPAIDINNGFAAFYSTPDVGMPDDGILIKGNLNEPCWVYDELRIDALERIRNSGAVFNFKCHRKISKLLASEFKVKSVNIL